MELKLSQIRFCAEECHRQKSGELSVYWMCDAYQHALSFAAGAWLDHICKIIGFRIEPIKNIHGYRKTPVRIGNRIMGYENIERQMTKLSEAKLSPAEIYQEFEEIHPFRDGNGRTGAILFNYLQGTLDSPVTPPDLFDEKLNVRLKQS